MFKHDLSTFYNQLKSASVTLKISTQCQSGKLHNWFLAFLYITDNYILHFYKCASLVKLKLLRSYFSNFYGSVLWNLLDSSTEEICAAWRKGLRCTLGLPWHTHSVLLAPITGMLLRRDELFCRMAIFVLMCIASNNSIVNFVARHGVYFRKMCLPIGLSTQLCCKCYNVSLYIFSCINRELIRHFEV